MQNPLVTKTVYGLEAFRLHKSNIDFVVNRLFFVKLFNTNDNLIIRTCLEQFLF